MQLILNIHYLNEYILLIQTIKLEKRKMFDKQQAKLVGELLALRADKNTVMHKALPTEVTHDVKMGQDCYALFCIDKCPAALSKISRGSRGVTRLNVPDNTTLIRVFLKTGNVWRMVQQYGDVVLSFKLFPVETLVSRSIVFRVDIHNQIVPSGMVCMLNGKLHLCLKGGECVMTSLRKGDSYIVKVCIVGNDGLTTTHVNRGTVISPATLDSMLTYNKELSNFLKWVETEAAIA